MTAQHSEPKNFIFKETGDRLLERLHFLKIHPKNILLQDNSKNIEPQQLIMLFPEAKIDVIALEDTRYDLIVDNCSLLNVLDFRKYLFLTKKNLNTNGLLIFCTLGIETFPQYYNFLHPDLKLTDMHNLGDLILNLHFADPVMEMEILNLNYNNPLTLIRDLKDGNLLDDSLQFNPIGPIETTLEIIYGHAWHKFGFENQFTDENNHTRISADSIEYLD